MHFGFLYFNNKQNSEYDLVFNFLKNVIIQTKLLVFHFASKENSKMQLDEQINSKTESSRVENQIEISETEIQKTKTKNSKNHSTAPKSSAFYLKVKKDADVKYKEALKRERELSKQNTKYAYEIFGEMLVKCFGNNWTLVDIEKLSKFLQTHKNEIKHQCQKNPEIESDEKNSIRQIKDHLKLIKDRKKQLQKKQA